MSSDNDKDPPLPYTFDLLWDLKTQSQLRRCLLEHVTELVEMQEAMRQHGISFEWDTSFEVTPQQMERIAVVSRFIKDPSDANWEAIAIRLGPMRELVRYEIASSWWLPYVSMLGLRGLVGRYFVRLSSRKLLEYRKQVEFDKRQEGNSRELRS